MKTSPALPYISVCVCVWERERKRWVENKVTEVPRVNVGTVSLKAMLKPCGRPKLPRRPHHPCRTVDMRGNDPVMTLTPSPTRDAESPTAHRCRQAAPTLPRRRRYSSEESSSSLSMLVFSSFTRYAPSQK